MNTRLTSIIYSVAATLALGYGQLWAAAPSGYYDDAEGLNKGALLQALEEIVGPHTNIGYDGLWDIYYESDVRDDGTIWDMYSTARFIPGTDQNHGDSSGSIGVNYNREHSFPKSWFNDASPMYSDAFHIYPADARVNSQRSNYPYGECEGGTRLPDANGAHALGRLGTCTYPGYSGTVFEPDDEYKGDFARTYFYMAAAYNSRIASWSSDQLAGNSYPAFSSWSVNMLMEWHRNDPVSQKELDRNEVVYEWQHNRNPFIDHPELAEYIWGDRKNEGWTPEDGGGSGGGDTPDPSHTLQFDVTGTLTFSAVVGSASSYRQVTAIAENLSQSITVSVTGNFELSSNGSSNWASSLTLSSTGGTFYVRMKALNTVGNHSGLLSMTSGSYTAQAIALAGSVTTAPTTATFIEDFEWTDYPRSYYVGDFQGNACRWIINGMYLGNSSSDHPIDEYNARIRKSKGGSIAMGQDKSSGAGTLSFYGGAYGNDEDADVEISYSTNGGSSWTTLQTVTLTGGSLQEYVIPVNVGGNIRFSFEIVDGDRINLDNIAISDRESSSVGNVETSALRATSPSPGLLSIAVPQAVAVKIYSTDGTLVRNAVIDGTATIALPRGIYIIKAPGQAIKAIVK